MNIDYIEDLVNTYLEDSAGAYINYKKLNVIIYDTTKIKSSTYKKEVLAEELRTLLL